MWAWQDSQVIIQQNNHTNEHAISTAVHPQSSTISYSSEAPSTAFSCEMTQAETIQGPTCDTHSQAGCSSDLWCSVSCVTLTSPADSPRLCLISFCRQHSAASSQYFSFIGQYTHQLTRLWSCIISVTFPLTVHAPSWLFLRQPASASRSSRDARSNAPRRGGGWRFAALPPTAGHFIRLTSLSYFFTHLTPSNTYSLKLVWHTFLK